MRMSSGLVRPALGGMFLACIGLLLTGCSGRKPDEAGRALSAVTNEAGPGEAPKADRASGVDVAPGAAVDASALGRLRIHIPKSALASLSGARIVKAADGALVREVPSAELENACLLPAGQYAVRLMFANPNYQPPTAGPAMRFDVLEGLGAELELGAVAFSVKSGLGDLNIDGIRIVDSAGRVPALELGTHGNDFYLFKPKAVPAGNYAVELVYFRSPKPSVAASNVAVFAGRESAVTLDSGIQLAKPDAAGVLGWDLLPAGGSVPALEVRRGTDNDEPLWRRFIVPPGSYDLRMHLRDMGHVIAGRDLEIAPGRLLNIAPSL